jgi:hypothetical protein
LARGSLYLGLIMALGGPSCLLTQNPQFDGPQAVGPFIRVIGPRQGKVLAIAATQRSPLSYETKEVSFGVYSEDLDQPLYAALYLDADAGARDPFGVTQIPAGHIAGGGDGGLSQARPSVTIPFTIRPGTTRGCHALTLFIAHDFSSVVGRSVGPADDTASVSWIVDLDDGDPPNMMSGCPQVTQ